jgi:hypothetical protein
MQLTLAGVRWAWLRSELSDRGGSHGMHRIAVGPVVHLRDAAASCPCWCAMAWRHSELSDLTGGGGGAGFG